MTTEGGRRHRRARLPGDNDEEEQKSDNFECEDGEDREYYSTNEQGDNDDGDNKRKRSEGDGDDADGGG